MFVYEYLSDMRACTVKLLVRGAVYVHVPDVFAPPSVVAFMSGNVLFAASFPVLPSSLSFYLTAVGRKSERALFLHGCEIKLEREGLETWLYF